LLSLGIEISHIRVFIKKKEGEAVGCEENRTAGIRKKGASIREGFRPVICFQKTIRLSEYLKKKKG
jgi:hypothetical protein